MSNPFTRFVRNAPRSQKIALGGVASVAAATLLVGGAGAAFNSYQDSHTASGDVQNDAAVVLELSTGGGEFQQDDVATGQVSGLESGDSKRVTVSIKNAGTQEITLNDDTITTTGAAFTGDAGDKPDTVSLDQEYVGTTIPANQTVVATVTVAAPDGQDAATYAGTEGSWSITFGAVNSSHYTAPTD